MISVTESKQNGSLGFRILTPIPGDHEVTHHSKARLSNVRKKLLKCNLLFLAMPGGKKNVGQQSTVPEKMCDK